jgi:cell division protein FtsQ
VHAVAGGAVLSEPGAGATASTPVNPTALDHVHAAQVAQFCVPRITGTFFTNDLDVTRAAFEALPWVRRATVRRQWPNRLVVSIEEHRALARWNDEDGNRFVSVLGEAFGAPGEKAIGAALPLLLGPEGTEKEVAQRYAEFGRRLALIGQVPAVVALSARQAWTIRLGRGTAAAPRDDAGTGRSARPPTPSHDGLLLDLGREQARAPVLARLDRFVAHYAATLGRIGSRIDAVDLRYPNGFAARIPGFQATRASVSRAPTSKPAKKTASAKSARQR